MLRLNARRALLLAVAFTGAATGACFSSSSGTPSGDDAGGDAGGTDAASQPDSTMPMREAGTDGPDTTPAPDSGGETGASPSGDGGDAGGPGILLPGNVQYGTHIAVNHLTSKFYVAWTNTMATPRTTGIAVIDATTGVVSGEIDMNASGSPTVDETNNLIYVPTVVYPDGSAIGTPSVVVVDGTSDTPIAAKTIYQGQGQTIDAGQGIVLSNLGMTYVAVDPASSHLFAYLGDGFDNGFVFEYDTTTGVLLASIETVGTQPGSGGGNETGGGLVLDPSAHTLWVVGGDRAAFGPGATITTIDTQTFTVTATGTKQAANATDVTLDPNGDQALVFIPQVAASDAGGTLPTTGTVLLGSTTGMTTSALTAPAGLAASFGRVLGHEAYVYANSATGSHYLVSFDVADGGPWALHGQSAAITPQPAQGPFQTGSVLNAYSFEVVTDATHAYVVATMDYDTYLSDGTPITYGSPYVQYWALPLP